MKAKLNFKSKRAIIIAATMVVLAVGAGIGGYFYGKGNNQSGATNIDNQTSQNSSNDKGKTNPEKNDNKKDSNTNTNQNNGNANNNGENNGNADNGNTADNDNNNGNANANNGNNNNGNADNNAQNAGEDTDSTTVIETVTDINPWEAHAVAWTPEELKVLTAKVDVNKPKLDIKKVSYVQGEALEGDAVNTATQNGEDITFIITVKNTGDIDASKVMIYDTIPEGTTLKENSDGTLQTIKDKDGKEIKRIVWEKDIKAGETISVSFVVTVEIEEDEELKSVNIIENQATVNKEKTPKTQNPVITSKKTASLVEGDKVTELTNEDFVKEGQTIRYTISAKNDSKVDGITKISDTVPEGTTLIEESLDKDAIKTEKEENGKKVITLEWKNVKVEANKTTSVSFDVTVNKDAPKIIRNIATVGETNPPPTENEFFIDVSIKKVWDDNNNQDGKRPESLEVILSNGDKVTLNEKNGWEATIKDLPKYSENNEEIAYTWNESKLPEGYDLTDTSVNGIITTLTNTHIPEKIDVTVKKVWDDNNNQDGKRPGSLTVKLSTGEEVVLDNDNNWTATINDLPKYANGKEIEYTWTEVGLPETYELTNTNKVGTVTTLTNTHIPETTKATVKKVWDDNNNQDGKRPTSIQVSLNSGATVSLSKDNQWTATIDNLPKYANGKEIEYTWTEESVPEGYTLTGNSTSGVVTTLTNTHTPEKVDLTVKKVWDDSNNQDGKRPESLTVTLSNGAKVTLNEANGWEDTVTGLPKYANGQEIEYTWTEAKLPEGYTLTGNNTEGTITTITNSYTPEETTATVKKVWADNENQDGKRPTSITVKLSNGTEVTLNETNGWKETVTGLPKYANGTEISYTWTEGNVPDGYTLTGNSTSGTVTTLTNTHTPEKVDVTVKKVWDDSDNQDGKRPASITVALSNGTEVTLNEANSWEDTVTGLPKYANGQEIEYTWTEANLPDGYTLTGNNAEGTITTLTNTHTPEETEVTVKKVWNDSNDQDGKRPASITVKLSNGTEVTLNEANGWEETVTGLPKYANGTEITYTWAEENVPEGYTLTGNSTEGTVTTLTNTHTPEKTEATVKKVWDDSNDQDGKRPASITVTLSNGREVTLNKANGWTQTIKDLPKYANGQEIAYTWAEENVPEGYTLTGNNAEGTVTTLTNTHTPEETEATVKKVWDDSNDQDGKRPTSITVALSNGTEVTLNEANGWEETVTGLPKFANGTEIEYTWTEKNLSEDYTLSGNSTSGTVTTLTNTLLKPNVSVTKKQYLYNAETKQYEEAPKNKEVRANDILVYTLVATNSGNKAGNVKVRDPKPDNADNVEAWIDADEDFVKDSGETTVSLAQLNGTGYDLTVPANSKVVIAYKVKVNGYANEEVVNTAYYKNEGEEEKKADETRVVKIEDDMEIIPTTSEGGDPIPHTVVLVLDYSSSMNGDRLRDLKNALKGTSSKVGFFEEYFGGKGSTGNGNKLYIITYNSSASSPTLVTSYNQAVDVVDSASTGTGTNTIAGLNKAKTISDTDSSISVVLMTDGEPTYNSSGTFVPFGSKEINTQTVAVAKTITDHGNPMYVIGFGIGTTEEIPVDFVQKMTSSDGPNAHYYAASNASALAAAFETVVSEIINTDGEHSTESSENGIIKIKEGFTKGQDIEIYKGTYTEGTSTPYATFAWNEFFETGYAVYDETHKIISFNLGKYMEDEGMDTDEQVTIRFVAEGTAGKKSKNTKRSLKNAIPPSDPIPTYTGKKDTEKDEEKEEKKTNKEIEKENKATEKEIEKEEKQEEKTTEKENKVEETENEKDNKEKENKEEKVVKEEKESSSNKEEKEKEKVEEKTEKEEKKDENKEDKKDNQKENKEKDNQVKEENKDTKTEENNSTKSSSKVEQNSNKIEENENTNTEDNE